MLCHDSASSDLSAIFSYLGLTTSFVGTCTSMMFRLCRVEGPYRVYAAISQFSEPCLSSGGLLGSAFLQALELPASACKM